MTTSKDLTLSPPLRLELAAVPGHGVLDGAWWPYSHDLDVELAALVDHFPPAAGRVSRVLFSRPDWATAPRRVPIARGFLKTGSFPRDDTHVVILKLSDRSQLTVLVIPPETATNTAHTLSTTATSTTNRRTGAQLVERLRLDDSGDPGGHWADDGGAS
ncbi:DUF5994 family protein [Nocardioides ginsengisoli]|uniref:DUF5994 family protein n=1 Tax=Nocardioides ginsengisoli TaxID=363868 RepID=A0ABW3VYU7_9ACTN